MNSSKPFITLEHVSLRIPGGFVFEGTQWEIRRGQQWAVVGPNGSGKSILLKALFGKVPVVGGRILYHFGGSPVEHPLESPEAVKDRMAYVSSEYGKIPAIQGSGFYQARWSSFGDDEPQLVSEFVLRNGGTHLPARTGSEKDHWGFGIEDLWNKRLLALSDGELRRVMIADSLIRRPELLVLENLFAGLDASNKAKLKNSIRHMTEQGVVLILAVTRTEEIPEWATHVLLVDRNRVLAQGPKEEVIEKPLLKKPHQTGCGESHEKRFADPEGSAGPLLLQMERVSVSHGSKKILDEIDWEIRQGEHWALLGPNGAGKTTLLSLVLGDNPQAYANRITLFGRRRGSGETIWDIKSRVGWVSPELHLYYPRRFSCLEVVCSGFFDSIGLYRAVSDDQRQSAASLLTRLGIGELTEKALYRVSYGEQRVVLLARALVKNPLLLVLDEPCQGLDGSHRGLFLETVDRIGERGESTLIFVTHELDELPRVLTRALVLRGGRVMRRGPIGEVLKTEIR